MPNPQLDQFMHALMWKAVPAIFIAGIAGLLLREGLQWLERKAIKVGRDRRVTRANQDKPSAEIRRSQTAATGPKAPHCPSCNSAMVKRTAKRGAKTGSEFWGCPNYPRCRGTREA
jgi:hypothetical protein